MSVYAGNNEPEILTKELSIFLN